MSVIAVILVREKDLVEQYVGDISEMNGDYFLIPSGLMFTSTYNYLKAKVDPDIVYTARSFKLLGNFGKDAQKSFYRSLAMYLYFIFKNKGRTLKFYSHIRSTINSELVSPLTHLTILDTRLAKLRELDTRLYRTAITYYVINDDLYTTTIDSKLLNIDHCFFSSFLYMSISHDHGFTIIPGAYSTHRKITKYLYTLNGKHYWFRGNCLYYALNYNLAGEVVARSVLESTAYFGYDIALSTVLYTTYIEIERNVIAYNLEYMLECLQYIFGHCLIDEKEFDKYKKDADVHMVFKIRNNHISTAML